MPRRERRDVLRLCDADNAGVACRPLRVGEAVLVAGQPVTVCEAVGAGHKLALVDIRQGEPIRKYGQIIGFASREIPAGCHIHTHNCEVRSFARDYAFSSDVPPRPVAREERRFMGFARPGGRAGTRNYVAVISTVNCSASVCRQIASMVGPDILRDYPDVDGVLPIVHKAGCGAQLGGPDHEQLERTLAGFARHPNVAAYVLVGLGCEVAQASRLIESQKLVQVESLPGASSSPGRPPVIAIQEEGGIAKTVEAGVRAVLALLPRAAAVRRVPLPASNLILGLQCGGSDGWSGITANPALGAASDLLVAHGGTAVLAETPEIYGAEHLLTRRAVSPRVGEALVERILWWEWYTRIFGAEINNNPTPGNKEGGLTTIYEKSLGAIAKGGTTALEAVYRYAEPVTAKGLVVMDTPGYDPVSMTGIVAGGANVGAFTTGRGSVYGCKPSPCIKISTSTALFERMRDDIDIDAGVILEGVPVEEVGAAIFEKILAVASGEKTKSELQGVGEDEFAPWSIGPTL